MYDSTHSRAERAPTSLEYTQRLHYAAHGTENDGGAWWGAILSREFAPGEADVQSWPWRWLGSLSVSVLHPRWPPEARGWSRHTRRLCNSSPCT